MACLAAGWPVESGPIPGRCMIGAKVLWAASPPRRVHLNSRGRAWLLVVIICAAQWLALLPSVVSAAEDRHRIMVLPFRLYSPTTDADFSETLADLLASRLESSGRVVLEQPGALGTAYSLDSAPLDEQQRLRRAARERGVAFLVGGSLTELAGRFNMDLRVIPLQAGARPASILLRADNENELLEKIREASDRILVMISSEAQAPVLAIEISPAELENSVDRSVLLQKVGEVFDPERVRADVERIGKRPDLSAVRAEIDRSAAGIRVIYHLIPTTALTGGGLKSQDTTDVIAEVRVRGNRRIESDAILARIETRAGEPYLAPKVAADVREVYRLGFFRNVRVVSEESLDGRILIFEVEENPVVRRITITGNDNIGNDKIRDSLTLTTGSTLDFPLLFENQSRIEALYRAEGYYLADVSYEIDPIADEAVAVHFQVNENEKLRLTRIEFIGNEHFDDDELTQGFKTKVWRFWSYATRFLDNSGTYAEPVFLQDLRSVGEKYANAGFLQVEVGEPLVSALEEGLVVRVNIEEGDRFRVGELSFEGDPTADFEVLRETLALKKDEFFNRSLLTRDVEALEKRYTDNGYFFARVTPLTRTGDDSDHVDVNFAVEKGDLFFIQDIEVNGNTNTVDPVIRREMQLVEGQLYSARALSNSQSRLQSLGFFEEVNFETEPTDEVDQLDLAVNVVERPTGSLSFGAGFSSLDRFVVNGSISQANLFGRGYGVQASVDIGGRADRFFLSFSNPYFWGSNFGLNATLSQTEIEFEDFNEEQTGAQLVLSHLLDERGRTRGFLRYDFSSRKVRQASGVNAAALIFREVLNGEESTSLLGLSLRSDTRNDRVMPSRGHQIGASMEFAGLGGFSKFLRFEGRSAFYWPAPEWFPYRSTFSVSARGGWALPFNSISDFDLPEPSIGELSRVDDQRLPLDAVDDDLKLPLTERYFLGGLGTFQLRGFRSRSLGPRRPLLQQTNGTNFLGSLVSPVGYGNDSGNWVCRDFNPGTAENPTVINFQGDGDGECNDLSDRDISDFEDLDETDVIGGNKFFSLSLEHRFPISEALGLVGIVFLDMGNAFSENEDLWDVGLWRFGTGVGALWFSPFGPLEGFIGFPLDALEIEDSMVFEFSVGGASF